jgi:hypothetical protein
LSKSRQSETTDASRATAGARRSAALITPGCSQVQQANYLTEPLCSARFDESSAFTRLGHSPTRRRAATGSRQTSCCRNFLPAGSIRSSTRASIGTGRFERRPSFRISTRPTFNCARCGGWAYRVRARTSYPPSVGFRHGTRQEVGDVGR